jgi:hypothetical protein
MKKLKPVFDDKKFCFGSALSNLTGKKSELGSEFVTQDYGDYILFGLKKKGDKK